MTNFMGRGVRACKGMPLSKAFPRSIPAHTESIISTLSTTFSISTLKR